MSVPLQPQRVGHESHSRTGGVAEGRSGMSTASSSAATRSRSSRTCCCAPRAAALRAEGDRPRHRGRRRRSPPTSRSRGATTVPAHVHLRHRPQAARRRAGLARDDRRDGPDADPLRPLALHAAGPARERFPRPRRRRAAAPLHARRRRPEAPDREDPVRDLDRGDALLSERHLSPHDRRRAASRCCAPSRPTAIASPASRCRRPTGSAGMPGVIVPRKAVAEIQKLVEDGDGEVAVELSAAKIRLTFGGVGADLEADRRHLPGLSARHPGRQRQAARPSSAASSPRPSTASRRSRRSAAAR